MRLEQPHSQDYTWRTNVLTSQTMKMLTAGNVSTYLDSYDVMESISIILVIKNLATFKVVGTS